MAVQQELEPLFIEALRLLHSKSNDSSEQLKKLLDEALHHTTPSSVIHGHTSPSIKEKDSLIPAKIAASTYKKGSPKHQHISTDNFLSNTIPKSSSPGPLSSSSLTKSSKFDGVKSESGGEKRSHDKVSKSNSDSSSDSKKHKSDSSSSAKSSSSSSKLKIDLDHEVSISDENTSASDYALEMGLACVVCRSINVTPGNNLVECQDCHCLYHQECHKPPIDDQDVNDPRLVWYCAKCTKTLKKMVGKIKVSKNSKNAKPLSTSTAKETTTSKPVKSEPVVTPTTTSSHIFKRIEPKLTATNTSSASSGNKPIGLAGLAASLSGKSHPVSKTASQSSSSSKPATSFSSKTSSSADSSKTTITPTTKANPFPSLFTAAKSSSSYGGTSTSSSSSSSKPSGERSGSSSTSKAGSQTSTPSSSSSSSGNNGSSAAGGQSGGKSSGSSSLMSADKRLQIMKKKAAAKMQEKRRVSNK